MLIWRPPAIAHQDSVLSYIRKLTLDNFYSDVALLGSSAELVSDGRAFQSNLRAVAAGEVSFQGLAALTGEPIDTLRSLTYPPASQDSLWKSHVFCGSVVPWTSLHPTVPRYCPHCLAAGVDHSKVWDLAWYTVCHLHGQSLIESCACGSGMTWSWKRSGRCERCKEVRTATGDLAETFAVALDLSTQLAEIVETGTHDSNSFESLGELLEALELFSTLAIPESALGRFDFSPQLMTLKERRRISAFAWPLIRDFESSVSAMSSLIAGSRSRFPCLPTQPITLALRKAMRAMASRDLEQRLTDALSRAKAHSATAIEVDESAYANEWATVEVAAEIMDTSQHNVKCLLSDGVLDKQRAFPDSKTSDWLVSVADLNSLFRKIRRHAVPIKIPKWRSLNDVSRTPNGSKAGGFAAIVTAVSEGRFRSSFPTDKDCRFSCLTVLIPTVDSKVTQLDGFTVAELVAKTGVYADAFYRVMRAGLLPYQQTGAKRSAPRIVKAGDWEGFQRDYALVTVLAKELRTNPTNLSDRLIDAGLEPVSGPKVDKGLVYVFKRADLARLDLNEVLSKTAYKSRSGRPRKEAQKSAVPPGTLESAAAAEALGLTVHAVGKLVDEGVLDEHTDSRRAANRRYLFIDQVEKYQRLYSANPDLVSVDDCLADLGCSRRSFFVRYANQGRIEVVNSPDGATFVRRTSLKACIESAPHLAP